MARQNRLVGTGRLTLELSAGRDCALSLSRGSGVMDNSGKSHSANSHWSVSAKCIVNLDAQAVAI